MFAISLLAKQNECYLTDSSQYPIIKIEITKKRSFNLLMNYKHIKEKCNTLMKAFECNHKINDNINWNWKNKQYGNLLQEIAFNCIILSKSYNVFLPKLGDTKRNVMDEQIYINNHLFFLKLFFQNKRIVFMNMIQQNKWELFFICLNDLMNSKFIMSAKYTQLAQVLIRTFFYWTYEHMCFLIEHKFLQSISTALINGYFHKQQRDAKIRLMIDFILKIFYIIDKMTNVDNNDWRFDIDFFLKHILIDDHKLEKTKRKICYNNYLRQIQILRTTLFRWIICQRIGMRLTDPEFIQHLNTKLFKICANKKCKIYKNETNPSLRMKICKGCKVVYYCSYKCQKYDWKFSHKNQCNALNKKLWK